MGMLHFSEGLFFLTSDKTMKNDTGWCSKRESKCRTKFHKAKPFWWEGTAGHQNRCWDVRFFHSVWKWQIIAVKHGKYRKWRVRGGVNVKRQEEEEKWHTGQCILMSIKKQHHDRKRSIKPESCDRVTNSKDRAMPQFLPTVLCSCSSLSFSVSLHVVTLNVFPSATPWPPCAL